MQPIDILILSNGPGEVSTWVRSVVKALGENLALDEGKIRISVILSPCPHATGKEAEIVLSYKEVHRVQKAEHFLQFLLFGKTVDNWDWYEQGIVLFLGGDQFFTLIIGKRLKYKTIVYAEWEARWYRWIDRFAMMNADILNKISPEYHHKFILVGDLMADVRGEKTLTSLSKEEKLIGLLPGSKAAKLAQGLPLCLAIAEYIRAHQPEYEFIIPVAPTIDLPYLASFANSQANPVLEKMGGVSAKLIVSQEEETAWLETNTGLLIRLYTQFPAYEILSQCQLCLTTVGANTAELGALAIPMIVLLPTQQLDAMRAWNGIPGILANLPGVGSYFAKLINWLVLRRKPLFAWPNIWAKEEIVPELVGELKASEVGELVISLLVNSRKLKYISNCLKKLRGNPGAAEKIAAIIIKYLYKYNN